MKVKKKAAPTSNHRLTAVAGIGLFLLVLMVLLAPGVRKYMSTHPVLGLLFSPASEPASPNDFQVKGIDVSYYQGRINWQKVKQRTPARFAFIKATQGEKGKDPMFHRNWTGAKKVGMMRGAYHFYTPSRDAEAQARNFIRNVELEAGDLPPVLDVERTEGRTEDEIREGVQIWLSKVEKKYGLVPILYTNYRFYHRYLQGHFDDYPVWIAHYHTQSPSIAHSEGWTFWQHSEKGQVQGVNCLVDMNVYCGSMEALRSLCMPQRN